MFETLYFVHQNYKILQSFSNLTNLSSSGQTILLGMGELHLEVIQDRIRSEYGIEVDLGPLQVSYKETILDSVQETFTFDKIIGDHHHLVTVSLSLHPTGDESVPEHVKVVHSKETNLEGIRRDRLKAIENGLLSGLIQGKQYINLLTHL
jgi:elongation factor G